MDIPKKQIRRSAPEILAFHFGMDIADMRDYRYQPTRYSVPAIYTLDYKHNGKEYSYLAAPSSGKMPKNYASLEWEQIGQEYGRPIFGATGGEI